MCPSSYNESDKSEMFILKRSSEVTSGWWPDEVVPSGQQVRRPGGRLAKHGEGSGQSQLEMVSFTEEQHRKSGHCKSSSH